MEANLAVQIGHGTSLEAADPVEEAVVLAPRTGVEEVAQARKQDNTEQAVVVACHRMASQEPSSEVVAGQERRRRVQDPFQRQCSRAAAAAVGKSRADRHSFPDFHGRFFTEKRRRT